MAISGKNSIASETSLKCSECGNVQKIYRKKSKLKKKKHVKHMWCWKDCKEVTAHIELGEDAYLPEWLREED